MTEFPDPTRLRLNRMASSAPTVYSLEGSPRLRFEFYDFQREAWPISTAGPYSSLTPLPGKTSRVSSRFMAVQSGSRPSILRRSALSIRSKLLVPHGPNVLC